MLLGQDRGRHQNRHLFVGLHRLEGGAYRDLRLAVADVPDDEAVHRCGQLHVGFDVFGRLTLVGCVLIEKRGLQLALPRGVRREREPGSHRTTGVQFDQLGRHLADSPLRLLAPAPPACRPEPIEPRRSPVTVFRGAVPFDLVDPIERHVQPVAALVLDDRDLEHRSLADTDPLHAAIDPDTVFEMHHVVARSERGGGCPGRLPEPPRPANPPGAPEDLMVGEHREPWQDETALECA